MQNVKKVQRHPAPAGRPQPLAFHDGTLWVGCLDTSRLYAIDTTTWSVLDDVAAPGKPYGIASFGGALLVVISLGEQDDRYFYRFVPGKGFDLESKTACPDLTGSHLASDGSDLYLVQMSNRRLLVLDAVGSVKRAIPLPSSCPGIAFAGGALHVISADEEFDHLQLATLDIGGANAKLSDEADIEPEARGLAYDGRAWWTSLRELGEIVSFAR
jgi:hypothetical protein